MQQLNIRGDQCGPEGIPVKRNQAQKTPADRKTRIKLHLKCC